MLVVSVVSVTYDSVSQIRAIVRLREGMSIVSGDAALSYRHLCVSLLASVMYVCWCVCV